MAPCSLVLESGPSSIQYIENKTIEGWNIDYFGIQKQEIASEKQIKQMFDAEMNQKSD